MITEEAQKSKGKMVKYLRWRQTANFAEIFWEWAILFENLKLTPKRDDMTSTIGLGADHQ
jgi:hypothetical protein